MKVFLTGVSCVGKTTIGAKLASLLGYPFFDLDHEIETFFGKPLERLQAECLSKHAFRRKACQALQHLLAQDETENSSPSPRSLAGIWVGQDKWHACRLGTPSSIVILPEKPMVQQRPTYAGLKPKGRFRTFQAGIADCFESCGTLGNA